MSLPKIRNNCIFLLLVLVSCETKPYLKHKLQVDKVADNCKGEDSKFSMNSNLNGERYKFQKCLDANFDNDKIIVERQGDTVVVQFKSTTNNKTLYNLTLDIDTYPRYNFLTIENSTFHIIPAKN
ncbi:MAG: hypothetical protein ABR502_04015 [Chitinophagaceae bacterium]